MNQKTNNRKILIVDDEPVLSDMFKSLFELEGFKCFTANDVNTALDLIVKINPDLIISDVMMPECDGFEFRKRVMEIEEAANIPFVFLTSKDNDEYVLKGYDLSIENYISKSTNLTILTKKIESLFKIKDKAEENKLEELTKAANEVSSELLPQEVPHVDGVKIAQQSIPFEGIPGGDFIDYITLKDGRLAIIVGDIMGKKWDAWFVSFAYISYLRSTIRHVIENFTNPDPADILTSLNDSILADNKLGNFFLSASIVLIDENKKTISFSGAGSLPMLQVDNKSDLKTYSSEGINLGILQDGSYDTSIINYKEGDKFYLYTDGLIEIYNPEKELLGFNKFKSILTENLDIFKTMDCIKSFGGNKFDDDVTMVSISC
jgi:sigma-B regulation protein RsbU (phosphoserine phosphatase)